MDDAHKSRFAFAHEKLGELEDLKQLLVIRTIRVMKSMHAIPRCLRAMRSSAIRRYRIKSPH